MTRKKKLLIRHHAGHYLATIVLCLMHESVLFLFGGLLLGIGYLLVLEMKRLLFLGITGVSFIIAGVGFLLNGLVGSFLSVFSLTYNRSVCRFCHD